MSDRIPPLVQFLKSCPQLGWSIQNPWVVRIYYGPQIDLEPVEILLDVLECRVPVVQSPRQEQILSDDRLHVGRRCQANQIVDALGMEIPAEALEVRREQHNVGLVDLMGRIPSA